jgi:hypothetical protein
MRRREFIALTGGAAIAWPLATLAQQPAMPTIAWLDSQNRESTREAIPAFQQGLAETGYIEGRNVVIEYHWAEGNHDRLQALATDLVRRQVAVIAASTTPSALAARAATQTIPIVFRIGTDRPIIIGVAKLRVEWPTAFEERGASVQALSALSMPIQEDRSSISSHPLADLGGLEASSYASSLLIERLPGFSSSQSSDHERGRSRRCAPACWRARWRARCGAGASWQPRAKA